MKVKQLLSIFMLSLSLSVHAQQVAESQNIFVMDFLQCIENHDSKALLKKLDKKYRKEQLRFLGGNKVQFINELFSGYLGSSDTFITPDFEELAQCTVEEIKYTEDGRVVYRFLCQCRDTYLGFELTLVQRGKKYGFVGAVG